MNRTLTERSVNPFAPELSKLLHLSINAHSVFWIAALSGAATPEGWAATEESRRETSLELRGKTLGPTPFQRGLDELLDEGLIECSMERAQIVLHLPESSIVAKAIRYTGGMQTNSSQSISDDSSPSPTLDINSSHSHKRTCNMSNSDSDNMTCDMGSRIKYIPGAGSKNVNSQNDLPFLKTEPLENVDETQPETPGIAPEDAPKNVNSQNNLHGSENLNSQGRISAAKLTEKLVDFWGTRSKRPRVRVVPTRVTMVRARLREGYTVEDLYQAIAGYCYSPWHRDGGWDTFEVALRNGGQVEKGQRLWLLHAPIQYIEEYQARTGQVVACRADEIEQRSREKHLADDYLERLNTARQTHEMREEKKREEDQRDDEATALALAEMGEDEEDSDGQ